MVYKRRKRGKKGRVKGSEGRKGINFFGELKEGLEVVTKKMRGKIRSYVERERGEGNALIGRGGARVGGKE